MVTMSTSLTSMVVSVFVVLVLAVNANVYILNIRIRKMDLRWYPAITKTIYHGRLRSTKRSFYSLKMFSLIYPKITSL